MAKKLALKKETLAELTTDQLRVVFGGGGQTDSCSCTSCDCSCEQNSCNFEAVGPAFNLLNQYLQANC